MVVFGRQVVEEVLVLEGLLIDHALAVEGVLVETLARGVGGYLGVDELEGLEKAAVAVGEWLAVGRVLFRNSLRVHDEFTDPQGSFRPVSVLCL